jgi:hypothetical protein
MQINSSKKQKKCDFLKIVCIFLKKYESFNKFIRFNSHFIFQIYSRNNSKINIKNTKKLSKNLNNLCQNYIFFGDVESRVGF